MTTGPDEPTTPDTSDSPDTPDSDDATTDGGPGAEIGMTEGEGSTFEPEEDPEGHQ